MFRFLVVLSFLSLSASVIPPQNPTGDCEPFIDVLTRSLVKAGAAYFADNSRSGSVFDPNQVYPLTPIQLFDTYYGGGATPSKFKESILRIYYADPGINGAAEADKDLIILRENIFNYLSAQSYELARDKFGVLIYQAINKFIPNSALWLSVRCLVEDDVGSAEKIIFTELERVRNNIGDFKFGNFINVGVGTTLAFAIDDTGSMSGEIRAAKQRAKMIIEERQGSLDEPRDFVLVPFNDPTVGPITVTSNPDTFKASIDRLHAHGGGDAPELALRGILLAIENSQEGSTVFVITDVDAKDIELQDVVVAQARQRNIKITFLLTNTISTTMCRFMRTGGPGSLTHRRCNTASFKKGLELYQYMATSTGGALLVIRKSDIFSATQVIDRTVRQGIVDIAIKTVTSGSHTFRVNIDASVKTVFFQNTGDCQRFTVSYEGRVLPLTDPVTIDNLFEGKINVTETHGEWMINVTANSKCSIKVIGRSTFGFVQTLAKQESGELARFEGQPLFSDEIVVLLNAYGKSSSTRVTSISLIAQTTGVVLTTHSIPFGDQTNSEFRYSPSMRPLIPIFISVHGIDQSGLTFTRLISTPIQFVHVQLACPNIGDIVFRPGDRITIPVTVRNNGATAATFELGATDTRSYITGGVTPSLVTVSGSGGIMTANITARAPDTEPVGTTSVITFTAKSSTSTSLLYKPCHLIVGQKSRPTVETFVVATTIKARFAETVMTSTVYNDAAVSREAQYYVILPVNAFITNFSMTIDGVVYNGRIEEKARAEAIYTTARERDLTVGHVAARDQSSSVFQTSTNLAPRKRVIFQLTYQEALQRKRGIYQYGVSFRMLQPVSMFSITVSISESVPLSTVNALGLETEQTSVPGPVPLQGITTVRNSPVSAVITYTPTSNQQHLISPFGLNGKFVIEYDVFRDRTTEMVIDQSYFAHFITSNLPPMSKRVVFLIDVSGSMFGIKIDQVRQAMNTILHGLAETDFFSVIAFNSSVSRWSPSGTAAVLASGTTANINSAMNFLNTTVVTRGGTDILQAVEAAIQLFDSAATGGTNTASDFMVLLTDGRPTDGTVSSTAIISAIRNLNRGRFGINTIGFGTLVDMNLLRKIAAQNSGTSIQIFIDLNSYAQISNFYEEISQPILSNTTMTYEQEVDHFYYQQFPALMQDGELITAGVIEARFVTNPRRRRRKRDVTFATLQADLRGDTRHGPESERHTVTPITVASQEGQNFAERLYNFLRLRGVLREIQGTTNATREAELRQLALNQSLELGFVTPGITSMIVLKPEDVREIENALAAERTTTVAVTTTRAPSTAAGGRTIAPTGIGLDRLFTPAPTIGRPSGVAGDPHVIVGLGLQITICFNWLGKQDEVYNLLNDTVNGISVNGKLAQTPVHISETDSPTFISDLGISLANQGINIQIDSFTLVIRIRGGRPQQFSLKKMFRIKRRGVWFENQPISYTRYELMIKLPQDIQFQIVSHVHAPNANIINHLDFSIVRSSGLSNATSGVLGQFPHNSEIAPATIDFIPNTQHALLWFRHSMVKVTNHIMYDSLTKRTIECWWVKNPMDLTGQSKHHYRRQALLDNPALAPK
nr:inter-alpha-trypsin inhibitor heavy chain H3 [Ciona intestinalis]|eukprot:XP_009859948.1 inter-alpha-trypsin inhibitor heavy chain H3 [Ciona intestinalis]